MENEIVILKEFTEKFTYSYIIFFAAKAYERL